MRVCVCGGGGKWKVTVWAPSEQHLLSRITAGK